MRTYGKLPVEGYLSQVEHDFGQTEYIPLAQFLITFCVEQMSCSSDKRVENDRDGFFSFQIKKVKTIKRIYANFHGHIS